MGLGPLVAETSSSEKASAGLAVNPTISEVTSDDHRSDGASEVSKSQADISDSGSSLAIQDTVSQRESSPLIVNLLLFFYFYYFKTNGLYHHVGLPRPQTAEREFPPIRRPNGIELALASVDE
jgi:hypothetical protein